jgi:hypothetical protein
LTVNRPELPAASASAFASAQSLPGDAASVVALGDEEVEQVGAVPHADHADHLAVLFVRPGLRHPVAEAVVREGPAQGLRPVGGEERLGRRAIVRIGQEAVGQRNDQGADRLRVVG